MGRRTLDDASIWLSDDELSITQLEEIFAGLAIAAWRMSVGVAEDKLREEAPSRRADWSGPRFAGQSAVGFRH